MTLPPPPGTSGTPAPPGPPGGGYGAMGPPGYGAMGPPWAPALPPPEERARRAAKLVIIWLVISGVWLGSTWAFWSIAAS
ncbi:MAG: hypothetical protein GEV11_05200, partial [Streptosporangiales bacterium]|nr:hypothetical protein [Streptosporangiales bacterium]